MKLIREDIEEVKVILEEDASSGKKSYFIEGVLCQAEKLNKNGRVYPIKTLKNEIDRYNTEYVSKNRAFGELGHPNCCHASTKILTSCGWKFIKDISDEEQVYTLNFENGKTELQTITRKIDAPYKGKMIEFKNRSFYTKVTPNHRFVVRDRYGNLSYMFAQNIKDNVKELRHHSIPKKLTEQTKKVTQDTITIEGIEWNLRDFVSFMGLWLAEGSSSKVQNKPNTYKINLSQNKGMKSEKIERLLERLPIGMNSYDRVREYNGREYTAWSKGSIFGRYLYKIGKAHEKFIPEEIIQNLDYDTANLLLEWYHLGDGRGSLNTKYEKADVFSVSERLIHDLAHVASIAGYAAHVTHEDRYEDCIIENRIIKAANRRRMWFLKLNKSESVALDDRFMSIEEVDYDGNVYCVETPNGNFFAMDETGYTFWTGNSPSINLDRVSHIITKMYQDGNNFIGRAKIVDTPMGNIVKGLLDGGATLGVSSRGVGTLRPYNGYQLVQDDFKLATAADIVADPSAPDAFVKGIMEGVDWFFDGNEWKAAEISENVKKNMKTLSKRQVEETALKIFEGYISKIAKL